MTPDLAVVIVSYETRERTLRCAESVLADADAGSLAVAVVVVDNASRDGSAAAVEERLGDRLRVLANPRNVGFGAACNQGAALWPRARHVLFLNADTEVRPGALASLVRTLDEAPEVGAAGPALTDTAGAEQPSVRGHPSRLALLHQHTALRFLRFGAAAYRRYKRPEYRVRADGSADVPVLMGAALLLRGEDFRALGGFDPRYFLYFEEADLCRRLGERDRRVRLVPAALVVHAGGESSEHDRERALVWYLESLFRYVDRFCGRRAGLLYRAVFKPLFLVRMVTDAVRDALTALLRPAKRPTKGAELRLAGRFLVRGVWTFLLS